MCACVCNFNSLELVSYDFAPMYIGNRAYNFHVYNFFSFSVI